jgi:hypothetical protein
MQTLRVSALVFVLACGSDGAIGPEGAAGTQGTMGDQGAKGDKGDQGDEGIDGQLRIYGNGSAGAATVAANGVLFTGVAADGNLQFTDFTINAGVTLAVPSGTIIRCTGTFTNNGTIIVGTAAIGGFTTVNGATSSTGMPGVRPALPGIALGPAGSGELGDATALRSGGQPGTGVGNQARLILKPGLYGGGGGAAALGGTTQGGQGGGSLVILASAAIVNAGTIDANGTNASAFGSGGGAGGVVVLASPGTITNTTINANGADGTATSSVAAGGGGGAGGLVHMLAPTVTAGTINVVAGAGGAAGAAGTITANPRAGGAGGGGCATNGGNGGGAQTTGAGNAGGSGSTGVTLQTLVDPTSLF